MTKDLNKRLGAGLFVLAFSLLSSTTSSAQTCVNSNRCDELGYSKETSTCSGKQTLKCPFDNNKAFCISAAEAGLGYKKGDTLMLNGIPIGKVIDLACPAAEELVTVEQCASQNNCIDLGYNYGNGLYNWSCLINNSRTELGTTVGNSKKDPISCIPNNGTNCAHGTVSTTGTRFGTIAEASAACAAMTTGGLTWYLPTNTQLANIKSFVGSFQDWVWDQSGAGFCGNGKEVECYAANKEYGTCWTKPAIVKCTQTDYKTFSSGYFCVASF